MKKIVCALAMGSLLICGACSSKPAAGEAAEGADSTAVAAETGTPETAKTEAEALVAELQAVLTDDTKSEAEVKTLLEKYKDEVEKLKAAGNSEAISAYVNTVDEYIQQNVGKLKAKYGEAAAVAGTVKSTVNEYIVNGDKKIDEAADKAKDDAAKLVESAKEDAKAKATETVEEAKQQAREKANEKVNEAAEKANKQVNEAAEKAKEKLNKKLGL